MVKMRHATDVAAHKTWEMRDRNLGNYTIYIREVGRLPKAHSLRSKWGMRREGVDEPPPKSTEKLQPKRVLYNDTTKQRHH